jgi:hypothetical protein
MRLQLTLVAGVALAAVVSPASAAALLDEDPTAEVTMQMFTDSDEVSVRSSIGQAQVRLPRAAVMSLQWNHERVQIPAISAPVGSAEAIDAITTASRPISGNAYEDFTKVRNEMTVGAGTKTASIGYYLSEEVDYLGQQVSAGWNRDLSDELLNVSVGASYGWDDIRPVSDDDTNTAPDTKTTVHWNAVGTRILSPTTLVRVGVELNSVHGLQHNPYRNVYAGGTNVPENHPDARLRRDLFLRLNHAMPNRASLRLGYRFYGDDWGVDSHELGARLNQYVTRSVYATYEYRYYTQGPADFYRDEYATTAGVDGYVTGDYRLAPLSSNLFGLALNLDGAAMETSSDVLGRMGFTLRWERYFNSNNYSANFLTTRLGYRF